MESFADFQPSPHDLAEEDEEEESVEELSDDDPESDVVVLEALVSSLMVRTTPVSEKARISYTTPRPESILALKCRFSLPFVPAKRVRKEYRPAIRAGKKDTGIAYSVRCVLGAEFLFAPL